MSMSVEASISNTGNLHIPEPLQLPEDIATKWRGDYQRGQALFEALACCSLSAEDIVHENEWGWPIDDSCFEEYDESAALPLGGLRDRIEAVAHQPGLRVGVDLAGGSRGVAIGQLVEAGLLDRGLCTNAGRVTDESLCQEVDFIQGDLTLQNTWQDIHDWQQEHAPEGFLVALHRPVGALQDLPRHTYIGLAELVLQMLKPGGIFFSQVPKIIRELTNRPYQRFLYEQLSALEGVQCIETGRMGFSRYVGSVLIHKAVST